MFAPSSNSFTDSVSTLKRYAVQTRNRLAKYNLRFTVLLLPSNVTRKLLFPEGPSRTKSIQVSSALYLRLLGAGTGAGVAVGVGMCVAVGGGHAIATVPYDRNQGHRSADVVIENTSLAASGVIGRMRRDKKHRSGFWGNLEA